MPNPLPSQNHKLACEQARNISKQAKIRGRRQARSVGAKTFLGAEVGVGEGGCIPSVAELLELLEIEPRLDPDLGLVHLLPPRLEGLEREVVQRAGHHLLLRLHHPHELQQRVLQAPHPENPHKFSTHKIATGEEAREREGGGGGRGLHLALVVLVDGEAGERVGLDAVGGGGGVVRAAEDVAGHGEGRGADEEQGGGGGGDGEEEEEGERSGGGGGGGPRRRSNAHPKLSLRYGFALGACGCGFFASCGGFLSLRRTGMTVWLLRRVDLERES